MHNKIILATLAFMSVIFSAQTQIVVDEITPADAVASLLGEGLEASNISFTGAPLQIGYLSGGEGTIFPMAEGVVLGSGAPESVEPGGAPGALVGTVSGEADLLTIANSVPPLIGQSFSVSSVNDVCILEFDFVPDGELLSFDYSFGSNEYLGFVNTQYNDVFAFLISGPGITGPYNAPPEFPGGAKNIAILPDTDPELPITISSVNNVLNDEYYINNPDNTDIIINGFTTELTAFSPVICGETYHIKLAIADGVDTILDSIVALESGSFNAAAVDITTQASVDPEVGVYISDTVAVEGCGNSSFTVTRFNTDEATTIWLDVSGTADATDFSPPIPEFIFLDSGIATEIIPLNAGYDLLLEGLENIEVSYSFESCGDTVTTTGSLWIQDYIEPVVELSHPEILCPGMDFTLTATEIEGYGPLEFSWQGGVEGPDLEITDDENDFYTVNYVDQCGYSGSTEILIAFPGITTVNLNVDDVYVCPSGEGEGTAVVSNGTEPFDVDWETGGSGLSETFFGGQAGEHNAIVTDFCGQMDTAFFNVIEPDPLAVDNVASYYCLGQDSDALFTGGSAPYTYEFIGDTLEILPGGGFTSEVPASSTVIVTDACNETLDFDLLFSTCNTVIPNVFTPTASSNDNLNDRFVILDLAGYPGSGLKIYNRWGQLVYESSNYKNTWDGDGLEDGVYYYVFERSDGENFTGNVSILRKNANE